MSGASFLSPTKYDFLRKLDYLLAQARTEAAERRAATLREQAGRGAFGDRRIFGLEKAVLPAHRHGVEKATGLVVGFHLDHDHSLHELVDLARDRLDAFTEQLLDLLRDEPGARAWGTSIPPGALSEIERNYRERVADAIRDVEIGIVAGTNVRKCRNVPHMSGTFFNIGQAGAVGPGAHARDMNFQQNWSQGVIDPAKLAEELVQLRCAMKNKAEWTPEEDEAIAAAENAAKQGNGPGALQYLKAAGVWVLGVAEKIGVPVAIEAIKQARGM